jgi:hypothetical protein
MSPLVITLTVVGVIAAFFMLGAGISKITGQPAMRQAAQHFSIAWDRYRLIGFLEVAAAVGILLGLWLNGLGLLAGLGVAALMAGAVVFHVRKGDPTKAMAPAFVALLVGGGYAALQAATIWS